MLAVRVSRSLNRPALGFPRAWYGDKRPLRKAARPSQGSGNAMRHNDRIKYLRMALILGAVVLLGCLLTPAHPAASERGRSG
jgi:hypothetical protein